jgi:N-acetylmuramoyl-L-alanine amidase
MVLVFLLTTFSQGYGKDTANKAVTTWLLVGYTIVIDPGHGGTDPDAVGFHGTLEKNISLTVDKRLGFFFQQAGAHVLLTRKLDKDLSDPDLFDFFAARSQDLSRRVSLANKSQAQFLLSIHLNHFPDPAEYGTQVFYQTGSVTGKELAEAIQKELNNYLIDSGRQALAGDFYLCRETKIPAVIIELGFLSNPEEEKKLNDPIYQMKAAWAIYAGVVNYLNLCNYSGRHRGAKAQRSKGK